MAKRGGFPGGMGGLIIGINANDMDIVGVTELGARRVDQFATEDKVKALHHDSLLNSKFAAKLAELTGGTKANCLKTGSLDVCGES